MQPPHLGCAAGTGRDGCPDDADDDRLAGQFRGTRSSLTCLRCGGGQGFSEDDDHGVDGIIAHEDLERVPEHRRSPVRGEVDGVGDCRSGNEDLAECVLRPLAEFRDGQPAALTRVRGENERATGVSDERDATSPGQRRGEQDGGDIEELLETVDLDDACALQERSDGNFRVAAAAVCERAPRAPADVLPAFSATIGLVSPTRRGRRPCPCRRPYPRRRAASSSSRAPPASASRGSPPRSRSSQPSRSFPPTRARCTATSTSAPPSRRPPSARRCPTTASTWCCPPSGTAPAGSRARRRAGSPTSPRAASSRSWSAAPASTCGRCSRACSSSRPWTRCGARGCARRWRRSGPTFWAAGPRDWTAASRAAARSARRGPSRWRS